MKTDREQKSSGIMKFTCIYPKVEPLTQRVGGFGTFDIETYRESGKDNFIPYCVVAYFNSNYFTTYYGESYTTKFNRKGVIITDPVCIVLFKLLDFMRAERLKTVNFFAHNLSSFDGFFILKACASYGLNLSILKRGSDIYYIRVKVGRYKIEFRCSLLLLQASLNNCAKFFNIPMNKIPFNHEWVTKDRLFYNGLTPEGFSSDSSVFIFKDYALEYCKRDCKILYEVLLVFDREVREFGVGLEMKSYSIPGFAFRVFRNKYLQFNTLANLSRHKNIEDFIRQGFYGGRTEVFRSYIGENKGYYYDVKGMYAEAMKQPLPCGDPTRISKFPDSWLNEGMHKGFYTVLVNAPKMYIPVLPYRTDEDKLIFPWGKWTGTYYSEELLLAQSMGYKFEPIEAIIFKESKPFLRQYVEDFTKIKERGGVYRTIGKLFINSLYGRFGLKSSDETTVVIPREREDYYSHRFQITDRVEVGGSLLLSYSAKPVLEFYKRNDIFSNYKKDLMEYKKKTFFMETNVALAAAITSLGRIRLYKDILSVRENGGKVAYCDTDSIFAQFEYSPLGLHHGNVYWDPQNPLTTFEEGVFLAPKMYSIKGLHSRVKGVKLNFASHNSFLATLKSKASSMKFDSLTQFYRHGYDIMLRNVDKVYSLWQDDKREWYKNKEGVWVTRALEITPEMRLVSPGAITPPPLADMTFLKSLNRPVKHRSYQPLGSEIGVRVDKTDAVITAPANTGQYELLYYAVMSKLHLPVTPIFMKILYNTQDGRYYTLGPYFYNPTLHFTYSLNNFIEFVKQLISKNEEKYDIKTSGKIIFRVVFREEDRLQIAKHEIIYPITPSIKQMVLLREFEEIEELRKSHEKEVVKLDRALKLGQERVGRIKNTFLSDTKFIIMKLKECIQPVKAIDGLVPSLDDRVKIKDHLINSIIEARVKFQKPSLQKVLGVFLGKVEVFNKDIFIRYLRAAIILIRWLSSEKLITLTKSGRYAPYLLDFPEEKEITIFEREFYSDKLFFSKDQYNPDKSEISQELSYIELTPVTLYHDYFTYIKEVLKQIEGGGLNRETYGFSLDPETFEGDLLSLNEGIKHYDYICDEMRKRGVDCFYYYWVSDFRGRLYPKLTNFSIHSSRMLRPGFRPEASPVNMFTKEEIFNEVNYRYYIVNLIKKGVRGVDWSGDNNVDFNTAVVLLENFEINRSKAHYEIIMRKMELKKLMAGESVQIAPISLDGRCNVYQHFSALTRDKFIAPFVNTTPHSRSEDLYEWFSTKLIEELKAKSGEEKYAEILLDLNDRGLDIRSLIKQPIMTYPYGSTPYNIREHVRSTLKNYIKFVDWDLVRYISNLIIRLRKDSLSRVEKLQEFWGGVLKDCSIISWRLPDGFIVAQQYFKSEEVKISTTFEGREMTTTMRYLKDERNKRQNLQSITANVIHSLDAFHLRRVIRTAQELQIWLFPIHDCILLDIHDIRPMKEIIANQFNEMYKHPEELLKSIYRSIMDNNPEIGLDPNINEKIKELMGSANISATKHLFNY